MALSVEIYYPTSFIVLFAAERNFRLICCHSHDRQGRTFNCEEASSSYMSQKHTYRKVIWVVDAHVTRK